MDTETRKEDESANGLPPNHARARPVRSDCRGRPHGGNAETTGGYPNAGRPSRAWFFVPFAPFAPSAPQVSGASERR